MDLTEHLTLHAVTQEPLLYENYLVTVATRNKNQLSVSIISKHTQDNIFFVVYSSIL